MSIISTASDFVSFAFSWIARLLSLSLTRDGPAALLGLGRLLAHAPQQPCHLVVVHHLDDLGGRILRRLREAHHLASLLSSCVNSAIPASMFLVDPPRSRALFPGCRGANRGDRGRSSSPRAVRAMFYGYLTVIVSGIVFFSIIGLTPTDPVRRS